MKYAILVVIAVPVLVISLIGALARAVIQVTNAVEDATMEFLG